MSLHFSTDERRALEHGLAAGRNDCPRCGGNIDRQTVPQRSDVAYVRDRITVTCIGCGATTVLDRRRIERAPEGP